MAGKIARQELNYRGPVYGELERVCLQTASAWVALHNALLKLKRVSPKDEEALTNADDPANSAEAMKAAHAELADNDPGPIPESLRR